MASRHGGQGESNMKFLIIDYTFPDCSGTAVEGKDCGSKTNLANVRGTFFATDQAAFLAGYLAAGMTKTGAVGTFGGIELPTVTIYMKGFQAGVMYYNTKHSTNVKVLGWDDVAAIKAFSPATSLLPMTAIPSLSSWCRKALTLSCRWLVV